MENQFFFFIQSALKDHVLWVPSWTPEEAKSRFGSIPLRWDSLLGFGWRWSCSRCHRTTYQECSIWSSRGSNDRWKYKRHTASRDSEHEGVTLEDPEHTWTSTGLVEWTVTVRSRSEQYPEFWHSVLNKKERKGINTIHQPTGTWRLPYCGKASNGWRNIPNATAPH